MVYNGITYGAEKTMRVEHKPSVRVQGVLKRLGRDVKQARLLRRIPMRIVAERAGISRVTLQRVEEGSPGVSVGIVASVLNAIGLLRNLDGIVALDNDSVGLERIALGLPKRARVPKNILK